MTITTPLLSGLILTTSMVALGCEGPRNEPSGSTESTAQPPLVFAVNFPLQSFAQELGGSSVRVESPCLEGESSLSFAPTPEQIIGIQDARLILLNGADFAGWTANASLPSSRTVVTAEEFRGEWLESSHHHHDHDHQHGPDGDGVHHHAHWASYTWLDPSHARDQAIAVAAGMRGMLNVSGIKAMAERSETLLGGLGKLVDQAAAIRASSIPPVIASEPVYEYFAAGCGLDMHNADWHWDQPEPHDGLDGLRKLVEATGARHLLVPATPTSERLEVLKGLGLEPVVIMPLADPPSADSTESFTTLMGRNLDRIQGLAVSQPAE